MVTATKNRPASRPALLVNKTHLPHELDQGLGARLRIGLIELATDQTSEHEFRRIFALPGVDFYEFAHLERRHHHSGDAGAHGDGRRGRHARDHAELED